jgi:hypothetical protein
LNCIQIYFVTFERKLQNCAYFVYLSAQSKGAFVQLKRSASQQSNSDHGTILRLGLQQDRFAKMAKRGCCQTRDQTETDRENEVREQLIK